MKNLTMQIQTKIHALQKQPSLPPEQLRYDLQNLAKLIEDYRNIALKGYKNSRIDEWQKNVNNRLADAVFKSELKKMRQGYEAWIAKQNKKKIEDELQSLERFFKLAESYRDNVEKMTQPNPYQGKVNQWLKIARERSVALLQEKKIFTEISELYTRWQSVVPNDPKGKMANSKMGIATCKEYQEKLQNRQISSYHQDTVREYLKEMLAAKTSMEKEMTMVAALEELQHRYEGASFATLAEEKSFLAKMLMQAKSYEQQLQLKEIRGFHSQQIKYLAVKSQTRQNLLVNEENLYAQIQAGWKKWQSKPWENLKDEHHALSKALDNCRNYKIKLKNVEITGYHSEQVQGWHRELERRKQKLDGEDTLFEILRRLQSEHLKQGSYPDLESEKTALSLLLEQFEKYRKQSENHTISGYYRQQIQKWYEENSAEESRLTVEEKIHAEIASAYEKWKTTSSWENGDQEAKAIAKVKAACLDYQTKLPLQKISGYYRKEVAKYLILLKTRAKRLNGEKKLFAEIENAAWLLKGKQFKYIEEEQLELKALISKCHEYKKELDSGKISDYHKTQLLSWNKKMEDKLQELQQVVDSVKKLKSAFESWRIVPRWPNLEKEEQALNKILAKAADYQKIAEESMTKNYEQKKVESWKKQVQIRQNHLQAEKKLYGKMKSLEQKINNGDFSSLSDEKKTIREIENLAGQHKKKTRAKQMSNHYQRSIRQMKKKLKTRTGKLDKEERKFKQVNKAYKRWQAKTWSPANEKRAINSVLDKINAYNEYLQMKKISRYYQKQVNDYKKEAEERKKKIAQSLSEN